MLDKLLEQAKSQLIPSLENDPEVDNAQAGQIAEVSSDTVINSLMGKAKSGDLSGVQEMLSGDDTSAGSPAASSLIPQLAENLASRIGLSPETAQSVAAKAVPLIMNMLNGKVRDAKNQGMDIGGMLGGLTGGGQGGGLLGKVSGMFGGGGGEDKNAGSKQNDISDILGKFL